MTELLYIKFAFGILKARKRKKFQEVFIYEVSSHFTIVIDSFGIGAMDNAAEYGDTGCDTFGHIADKVPEIKIPNLIRMGLTQLHPAPVLTSPQPSDRIGKYARLNEKATARTP